MKHMTAILGSFLLMFFIASCGVKGKPMPPLEPAEIGRGAPTYKRAAEQAKPSMVPDAGTKPLPSPTPDRRGP